MDVPLELSNAIYLKTLEKRIAFALEKRTEVTLNNDFRDNVGGAVPDPFVAVVNKLGLGQYMRVPGFNHFLTKKVSLEEINKQNDKMIARLKELFKIVSPHQPVAFAANTFYSLEFNNHRDLKNYEKFVYPLLKEKASYLSVDNIASSLLAFSRLPEPDAPTLKAILHAAKSKNFDLTLAEAHAFSIDSANSSTLPYEEELYMKTAAKDYFFRDQYILCDLHEALAGLHKKVSKSTLKDLEEVQKQVSQHLKPEVLDYHKELH